MKPSSKCYLLLIFIAAFYACSSGDQSKNKTKVSSIASLKRLNNSTAVKTKSAFLLQVDSLKMILSEADTLKPMGEDTTAIEKILNVNDKIYYKLSKILKDPEAKTQNLDTLLKHDFLGIVHSDDKRLWVFNWYENTGGSFQSYLSLVYHKTKSGQAVVTADNHGGSEEGNLFSSAGASFYEVYKLRSKTKDLYLCIGSGVGCTSCIFKTAVVVELKKDSTDFNYKAFNIPPHDVITYGTNDQSCLTIGARSGDIEKFEFNPKIQTLTLVYLTDDTTPITIDEGEEEQRIVRKLVFNGQKFVGDVFH